ncbi:MAG: hypothetical protein KF709_06250 [Gemmatimonadaceae bacterium]|nr:hypothetical protein [Gemmatimonadaceae bacterium]
MQFLIDLWVPILAGAAVAFIASALAWTVMPHHRKEYTKLPNEDAVLDAIRAGSPGIGQFAFPYVDDMKEANSPENKAKRERGPYGFLTLATPAEGMGGMMIQSFVFNAVVATFTAYVASHALQPGADYLAVFRLVGTIGFMAYGLGTVPDSIWFGRPWKAYALHATDALVYGLLMGGVFGWLWPR